MDEGRRANEGGRKITWDEEIKREQMTIKRKADDGNIQGKRKSERRE